MPIAANQSLPWVPVSSVLVPLDGSELALQAMPTGRALAQRLGAELHTITVAHKGEAERARTSAAAALGVPVDNGRVTVVTGGDPADVITHRAEELNSCVVCMATHGRGRLGGAVIGSVARSVLLRSKDPVIALGPSADNPGWSPRPRSWPEPLSVARIVACVDGSTTSEQVLPLAAAWAGGLAMSLTIVMAIDDVPDPLRPDLTKSRYGQHADAQSYLDELVEQWATRLPGVDGEIVIDPISPANAIRLHLDQRPAGLVALTTHARSGMQRVLLGATASDIVRASVAPCLVAPVKG